MKGKRTIRPEERALWRKVARSVTPLDDAKKQSLEHDEEPPLVPPSRNIDDPSGDVSARKPDRPLPQRHAAVGIAAVALVIPGHKNICAADCRCSSSICSSVAFA